MTDLTKYVAYIGGIGSGKSFGGALKSLVKVKENAGSLGMIAAPTYPMLRDATMRSVFEIFPRSLIRSFNKTDGLLTLKNDSEILFRSTDDPEKLRGPNLAWFWFDEGPLCGYHAWRIAKGRLRQPGYAHQAWVTGNPHGRDGFYQDFEGTPQPEHKLYHASTRDNLANLPDGFIEGLGYTGQFALQEIDGLFVAFEGLVYQFYPEQHIGVWRATNPDGHAHKPRLAIGGIDWGYTNPSVVLPIYVDGDDRAYVLDEFYKRQVGLDGVKTAVLEFTRKYRIETWYCGPDEPEHIEKLNQMFAANNLESRAIGADDEITIGIETVRQQMALRGDGTVGLYLAPGCLQTRNEFGIYSYPTTPEGVQAKRDPLEKPIKAFDHAMDALRYALHTALGHGRGVRITHDLLERTHVAPEYRPFGGVSLMKKVH